MNNDRLIEKLGEWEEQLQNYGVLLLDDHAIFAVICKLIENRPQVDEKFIGMVKNKIIDEYPLGAFHLLQLLRAAFLKAGVEIEEEK